MDDKKEEIKEEQKVENVIEKKENQGFDFYSAREVQDAPATSGEGVIDGIIPKGSLCVLGAAIKSGKSWMALDMSLAIAKGEKFWNRNTCQGDVLYLALEDTRDRMRNRINILTNYEDAPPNIYFTHAARTLEDGLIEDLESFVESHPNTRLIIIDVLQLVRKDKNKSQSDYAFDYKGIAKIKKFANESNVSILMITHTKKGKERNQLHNISGSVGIVGACDTILEMESYDEGSSLYITGRDTIRQQLALQFNQDTCKWECLGTKDDMDLRSAIAEYQKSDIISFIKELLEVNDCWSGTCEQLLTLAQEKKGIMLSSTTSALSRRLNAFDELLMSQDSIEHIRPDPNGGVKGRIHTFKKMSVSIDDFGVVDKTSSYEQEDFEWMPIDIDESQLPF